MNYVSVLHDVVAKRWFFLYLPGLRPEAADSGDTLDPITVQSLRSKELRFEPTTVQPLCSEVPYINPRGLLHPITVQYLRSKVIYLKPHGLLSLITVQSFCSKVLYCKPHGLLNPIIVQSL